MTYRHRIAFMASFNNPSLAESEIRQAVRARLLATAEPGAFVRDELSVASARVDLARTGSRLEGFEIKSDFDTLDRLPRQVAAFSLLFDAMTLVVGDRHANEAVVAVPRWWGVLLATTNGDGSVRLCTARVTSAAIPGLRTPDVPRTFRADLRLRPDQGRDKAQTR